MWCIIDPLLGCVQLLQSGFGHMLCSAKTTQSTMDFSSKPVDDGVVDSPPDGGRRIFPIHSPSPLKFRAATSSPANGSKGNPITQRRLYDNDALAKRQPLCMDKVMALG
jgi:hypothetical protein